MKISIVVPVYNAEKYLHYCVESIINQTYKNIELILVDDGSKDNSPQLCDEYGDKYDWVKVFHKENGGQSSARNLGINNATGDYVSFVDSDDVIHPQYYEIISKIIKETKSQIVICSKKRINERDNIKIEKINNFDYETISINDIWKNDLVDYAEPILLNAFHTKVIAKELLKTHCFSEELRDEEDTLLSFELGLEVDKVVKTHVKLYFYVNETTSITRKKENAFKNWNYLFEARKIMIDKLIKENYEYSHKVIDNIFIELMRELRPIYIDNRDDFIKCKELVLSYFKPEMMSSFYGKLVYRNLNNNNFGFLFFILRGFIYNFYFKRI